MTKRILAWVLTLALVLSAMPVGVLAEGEKAAPALHSHSAAQHDCAHCEKTATWSAWGDTDAEKASLPKTSGHYYLVSDIKKTGRTEIGTDVDIVLCLNGYTVDGNNTDTIYRVVNGAKLRIDDCTAYTDAEGVYHVGKFINGKTTGGVGGTFYVNTTSTLTMTAGIIANGSNTRTTTDVGYGGTVHLRNTAQVTLENVVFENCTTTKDGGVISKRDAGTVLTVKNCTFKNNSAGTSGGAAYILNGGATFEGCTFTGNSAETGSVVYVRNGSTVTFKDCVFEENTAKSGSSGVFYLYGAKVELDGCTIKNNTAKGNGGSAIYMTYTSTATLKDTTITGNKFTGTSTGSRAAIYLTKAEDQLILKGKTVFENNLVATGGTAPFNRSIFLQAKLAKPIDIGGLTDGAKAEIYSNVAITEASELVGAATAPTKWNRTWVLCENNGNAIEYSAEKGFYFALNTDHVHCECGNLACTDADHEKVEYLPWNNKTALPTSGNYYLNADVNLAAETSVTTDLSLCLNGHTVTAAKDKRHISTPKDVNNTIVIADCTAATVDGVYKAGTFTGGVDKGSGQGGGAIYIRAGGTLKIYDGIFSNNTSITGGGAIRMAADTALVIEYAEFTGNTAVTADGKTWRSGGVISALTGADVQVLGGVFKDNKGLQGGAIYTEGKTLTLENVTFRDNDATSNAGAVYAKIATTTIKKSTFTGNYGAKDGGALYYREGKIDITDCDFADNECDTIGAAISFSGNAKATITGGTFEGGKATSGGAVVVQGDAVLTVNGGTYQNNPTTTYGGAFTLYNGHLILGGGAQITGNTANRGGAIDLRETSSLVLKDCTITGNTASSGGAVYINDKSSVSMEGAPRIMANQGGNLYLMDAGLIAVGTITDGANVCVTGNPGAFTEACADYALYFAADSKYLKVEYLDGALQLVAGGEHKHCLCDGMNASCDHTNIAWVAWEGTTSLPTSGSYYLLHDVVLTGEVSISKDLNLCLNGHTITAAKNNRILSTSTGADVTINISDCTAATMDGVYTAGKLTGGMENGDKVGGGAIYLRSGGKLNLYDGILTGNQGFAGGAMILTTNAVFTMYGGEISHNTAVDGENAKPGGAIYAMKGAVVDIKGGTFKNNAGSQGGAIYIDGASKLSVSGGVFANNEASTNGGAIYGKVAEVTITGGVFENNTSLKDGAALYYREGKIDLLGGTFQGNETQTAGGAISFSGAATGTIRDVVIENNKAGSGAAMIIQGGSSFVVESGTFTGNTCTGYGGALYVHASTVTVNNMTATGNSAKYGGAIAATTGSALTIQGGTFTGNTASTSGGAVYVASESVAIITDGLYAKNEAGTNAGGIYGIKSSITITGGTVSENTSAKDGAGIYFREGNMDISGDVVIRENVSKTAGGGVCYSGAATGTISGGIIEKNTAGSGGGMIIQGKSNVVISGGTIRQNSSTSAGGIYLYQSTLKLTGGTITQNKVTADGGGLRVNQESTLIIDGGTISKNQSKNGAGMVITNKSQVEMKSGKITDNNTKNGSGGAVYVSTGTNFKMSGGTISGNRVTGAAGGVYLLRSTGTFTGGSITGNYAEGAGGGGIYVNGSTAYLYGISITGNEAKATGGGVHSARNTMKKDGVSTDYSPHIYVSGAYIANNKAKTGGGLVASGNGGSLTFSSGTITNNKATNSTGGLYVSAKVTIKMTGGTVSNNVSDKSAGGFYSNKASGTIENAKFLNNTSGAAGGAMYLFRGSKLEFKNVLIDGNTATTVGGGVYGDSNTDYYTECMFTDCVFTGNTAGTRGGAFYGSFGVEFDAIGCTFEDNTAIGGGTDETTGNGGAIAVRDIARLKDCTFTGNKAQKGGAFYGGNMQLTYAVNGWGVKADDVAVTIENCTFEGNDAVENGGAIFNAMSSFATVTNCTFTGNSAAQKGSAIFAEEDLKLMDVTITGNVSGGNGYALYYADSEFDGMNYIRGLFKLGGDIIVKDNQGGDAYLDNLVTIAMMGQGFGPKTHIGVTLDKGVLTNRLYGAYNYEGGDQVYTVTYGTRSLTEPEVDPELKVLEHTPENQKTDAANGDIWLYVGIGVIGLAAIAGVVLLIAKKKKSAAAENK